MMSKIPESEDPNFVIYRITINNKPVLKRLEHYAYICRSAAWRAMPYEELMRGPFGAIMETPERYDVDPIELHRNSGGAKYYVTVYDKITNQTKTWQIPYYFFDKNPEFLELVMQNLPRHPRRWICMNAGSDDSSGDQAHENNQGDVDPMIARERSNAYLQLALKYMRQGLLNKAIERCESAIEADSENPHAYNNLGIALKRKGDTDGALRHYKRALQLDASNPRFHNNIGIVLEDKGDLEEAVIHYTEAVSNDPRYIDAHRNLAYALEDSGDLAGAVNHYRTVVALGNENPDDKADLENALTRIGRSDRGLDVVHSTTT